MPLRIARITQLIASALLLGATSLPSQPRIPTWHATELWRVDGTDAGDGFGEIRDLAVLKDGSVWILDFKDQQIRRYDANGKALPTVSRKGSGPGELQKANGMLVHQDGTVWVNDPSNARFSIFAADGKFARQQLISITSYGFRWEAWFDRTTNDLFDPVNRKRGELYVQPWRRIDATGKELREIDRPSCGAPHYSATSWQAETKSTGNNMVASYPFMTGGGFAPTGRDAVWCAAPGSRRVALIRIGRNDTLATTTLDISPVSVTVAERDSVIAAALKEARRYATNDFDPSRIPRTKPGIAALHVDDDGRLWVQHVRAAGARGTTYDIHDARGAHLGRLTVPFTVMDYLPMRARGSDAWFPVRGEDDVVSVVKMRVAR